MLPPLPLHPPSDSHPAATMSNAHPARKSELHRLVRAGEKASPKSPARVRVPAGTHGEPVGRRSSLPSLATAALVEIVRMAESPDGVSAEGENVQDAPLGKPVQERLAVPM